MENKDTRTFEINPKIEMKKVQFKKNESKIEFH